VVLTMIACLIPAAFSTGGITTGHGAIPRSHAHRSAVPAIIARRILDRHQAGDEIPPRELARSIPECIPSLAERSGIATQGQHRSAIVFLWMRTIRNFAHCARNTPESAIPRPHLAPCTS